MRWSGCAVVVVASLLVMISQVAAQIPQAAPGDWPWWRGPNFNGVAEAG